MSERKGVSWCHSSVEYVRNTVQSFLGLALNLNLVSRIKWNGTSSLQQKHALCVQLHCAFDLYTHAYQYFYSSKEEEEMHVQYLQPTWTCLSNIQSIKSKRWLIDTVFFKILFNNSSVNFLFTHSNTHHQFSGHWESEIVKTGNRVIY